MSPNGASAPQAAVSTTRDGAVALVTLTRSVARAVARQGITVNCVIPGSIDTELPQALRYAGPARVTELIPAGRWCRPEDVAHAAAFLCDPQSSYIIGAVLTLDGEMSMGG